MFDTTWTRDAPDASRELYSSSIWLYITRTATGVLTAPFVLASSIWLLEGPPFNGLIATVKVRRSVTFSCVPCADSPTLPRLRADRPQGCDRQGLADPGARVN